jgi:hypothetical protein
MHMGESTIKGTGENEMLTPEECAKWLRISPRVLADNTRRGRIPVHRVNKAIQRYHKPTVMAALSKGS